MEPVTSNSASNTCPDPISSNCVQVNSPVPGTQGLCYPATLTQVITNLGNVFTGGGGTGGLGGVTITGLDLGCLYSDTIGTCPAGWTFVPATATVAAHCSNGCPPNSNSPVIGPSGTVICTPCFPTPCPAPNVVWVPNPTPPPTTLAGILQLMINAIPCCNPCSASASSSANQVPTP
jgi:hypothetical protein